MRARLRGLIAGLCCSLISASVAFSPLAHALVASSIGIGDDGAGRTQMEHHAYHGDSKTAMAVAETSLDDGGVPIHCNQFGESGVCPRLCSACLSAIHQPVDVFQEAPHSYAWLQHYAVVNLLVDAKPRLKPPRH